MKIITLKALQHRQQECIGIYFSTTSPASISIRKIKTIKWSQTNKCWYLPLSKENYDTLRKAIGKLEPIDNTHLKKYLEEKNKKTVAIKSVDSSVKKIIPPDILKNISAENALALSLFIQELKLKSYSPSTIRTYKNELMQLLQVLKKIPVNSLQTSDVKRYMLFVIEKGISDNTAHSRLNALKFYFEQVLHREKFFLEIPRPKKQLLLPKLLNETEIRNLFNALTNKKHKAMLFTAYSAGLRVSEIVNLKIIHIDSDRMQILIEQGKGKKDRYVSLSPVLLDILRNYISTYKPRPKKYLFESETTGKAYPTRTVQQIFTNAKNKAGIKKEVGIHSLRHSFATHLLDKGTDIKYIKELLGHFNIKTTEIYLHLTKKQLVNIISPFDDLWGKKEIDW
jgi:integrase/recombinase XerD